MKIGLIGPPLSGKSTLFAAITSQTPDPALAHHKHSALIKVPDPRVEELSAHHRPKKTTHADIEIIDFPGISSRDDTGKQQLKKHLPDIRLCEAVVAVVRGFGEGANPGKQLEALNDDFIFADLETVMGRIERLEKGLKKPTRSHDQEKRELALLQRCQEALEELRPLSTVLEHVEDSALLRAYALLTEKPLIVVVNVDESAAAAPPSITYEHAHAVMNVCAEAEAQIAQLDRESDRIAFLADLGIAVPARDRFIQSCYDAVGMISFLTGGPEEVRAWPIRKGSNAVEAAGKVHSDMARGFIRAETVAFEDFAAADGDMKAIRSAGKLRQEGKQYVVQDGDIINFKFNV